MNIFGVEVNQSNIALFFALLLAGGGGFIGLYWRLRTLWFDQQQTFLNHVDARINAANAAQTVQVQAQLDAQTSRIENCIHQTPGHPENPVNSVNPPIQ